MAAAGKRSHGAERSAERAVELKRVAKTSRYFSRAVGKALEVLELLRGSAEPLSLNEIGKRVKLVKSSLFRIMYTLEEGGYLRKNGAGCYELSPDASPLFARRFANRLSEAAAGPMMRLGRECRETVSLGVLMDNHIEVVHVVDSPELVRMGSIIGRILPPHASSLGKVVTAYQCEALREKLLRNYGLPYLTPKTITDETELREAYERIRAQGYSTDMEETTAGGCCMAVPIFSRGDLVFSAISISLPLMRLGERQKQLLALLTSTSKEISAAQ